LLGATRRSLRRGRRAEAPSGLVEGARRIRCSEILAPSRCRRRQRGDWVLRPPPPEFACREGRASYMPPA